MVKWMDVEHVTYRTEWKATILGDDEGGKCLSLVSRSCSDQHSIYLCFLFGALFQWVISVPWTLHMSMSPNHKFTQEFLSYKIVFSIQSSLWKGFQIAAVVDPNAQIGQSVCSSLLVLLECIWEADHRIHTGMLRHLCTVSCSCCWSGLVGTSRAVKKLSR